MSLPLTKTWDRADFTELAVELAMVDQSLKPDNPNCHDFRRWEYAMALRAQAVWWDQTRVPSRVAADVGGAGSPFWQMAGEMTQVIDPQEGWPLDRWVHEQRKMFGQVYCISVLEHVEDVDQFCYHLSCVTAPGGLLFLTVDFQPEDDLPDTKMYHWMRRQIFTPDTWRGLIEIFERHDCYLLGEYDPRYHGPYEALGYSSASIALLKRS
jgi:hypothetical protein